MNIGIDFGSAYSTISRYLAEEERAEPLTLSEGAPASIPSLVSIDKYGDIYIGNDVKNVLGQEGVTVYEAFKMLLVEDEQKILEKRGYTGKITPAYIAARFLEEILSGVLNQYAEPDENIDELVICFPEVWNTRLRMLDGKSILLDILKKQVHLPENREIRNVRTVTEPEAASAYFAYNYQKKTNQNFNGFLLLIDYGGGTLDLTLTQVISGKTSIEIRHCESGGAGEHHPDENGNFLIGNAGIAYMNKVADLAVRDTREISKAPDFTSPEFVKAVHALEDRLKTPKQMQLIELEFGRLGSNYSDYQKILKQPAKRFCSISYQKTDVIVTYQHLYLAYQQVIAPVLQKHVEDISQKVKKYINADPRTIQAGIHNNFKIAIVGGYGSFFLVRKQIAEIYHLDAAPEQDLRLKDINTSQRALAISLGAALLASRRVILHMTARYSIGLLSTDTQGKSRHLYYGIHFHQQVMPGTVYYLLRSDTEPDIPRNRVIYSAVKGNIRNFIITFTPDKKKGFPMPLRYEFLKRLEQIPDGGLWNLGFSMDENEVITFHAVPISGDNRRTDIRLDNYNVMFELTALNNGDEVYAE